MSNLNDYIYIYYIRNGDLIYDRSVSRFGLGLDRAKGRVEKWNKSGYESFYTIGTTVREPAFY